MGARKEGKGPYGKARSPDNILAPCAEGELRRENFLDQSRPKKEVFLSTLILLKPAGSWRILDEADGQHRGWKC